MAVKKAAGAGAPAPAIEDGALYSVVLTKSITVGRSVVHPGPRVRLRGDVLKSTMSADAAAVTSFEPV